MATRLRLVSLLAAVLLAAVVGVGSFLATGSSDKASADLIAGQFSLETTAAAVVPLGSNVVVGARNDHDGSVAYQAAQWKIDYDQLVVTFVSAIKDGAAPVNCASASDNGDTLLLGCIDVTGPNLTYSGNAWNATFNCTNPGLAPWTLVETAGATAKTFVKIGSTLQAAHFHSATSACIPTADISTTKTADPFVVAGGVVNNTVTSTNNGPQNWTAAVVVDDMPEPGGDYTTPPLGTVDIDVNGDTVVDMPGLPCVPGYLAASSVDTNGDTVPDVIQANVMACIADLLVPGLSIAPGGSIKLTHQYQTTADSCNRTLIDVGMGVSLDTGFAGPVVEIVDPDFLDGIDFPPGGDDNFAIGITQVGDCQINVAKTAPLEGAIGDVVTYTVVVSNPGPSQATNVVLNDALPANLALQTVVGCTNTGSGNSIVCNLGTIASGGSVTITYTAEVLDSNPATCNTANVTWTRSPSGADSDGPKCFVASPAFVGLVKSVDLDGDTTPDPNEIPTGDTFLVNLWLCTDQASDKIDNDGNSTVDDELPTCTNNGEGNLRVTELLYWPNDCDTRNDDDDNDGLPVDESVAPGCPAPTLQDYMDGLVDKCSLTDGSVPPNTTCEGPEGLGAFEFQLKFDHKIFDITIKESGTDGIDNDHDTLIDEPDENNDWAGTRSVNCSMTIITENDIRFGCVTTGTGGAVLKGNKIEGVTIMVSPEADLTFRIRPTKDNGVVRRLLDENCEIADIFGDIYPGTNAGLTPDCTDLDITVRKLEGDVNGDCKVGVEDAQLIAFRYGSFFGHLVYDQNYDLEPWPTADFDIDIKDLQFVFGRDGSQCSAPIPSQQDPQAASGVGQP